MPSYIEWGDTPTLARCGGVAVGSTLPSHTYKRDGGLVENFGPKHRIVPQGTLHEFFQILHAQTSWFGCVSLLDLASYSFTHLTFCQAIALHNVSYKGLASLCNVAFMTH